MPRSFLKILNQVIYSTHAYVRRVWGKTLRGACRQKNPTKTRKFSMPKKFQCLSAIYDKEVEQQRGRAQKLDEYVPYPEL